MSLTAAYREVAVEMLEGGREIVTDDIVTEVMRRYPEDWADAGSRLQFGAGSGSAPSPALPSPARSGGDRAV